MPQIQELRYPSGPLGELPLLADYFLEKGLFWEDVVVVSPRHSGVVQA